MKTYKLTLAALFALALLALATAILIAAPIPPRHVVKAHSDEWNARYFERNVNTSFTAPVTEYIPPGLRQGGLAGYQRDVAKPIPPRQLFKAHSDAWNAYYFERNVNTSFTAPAREYLDPALRRGGLAK
jgi:hypothetical protein